MAHFISGEIEKPWYDHTKQLIHRIGFLRTLNLVMLLVILLLLPFSVFMTRQTQTLKQHAAEVQPFLTPPPGCYVKYSDACTNCQKNGTCSTCPVSLICSAQAQIPPKIELK